MNVLLLSHAKLSIRLACTARGCTKLASEIFDSMAIIFSNRSSWELLTPTMCVGAEQGGSAERV
jgi:hypothetical protein